MPVQPFRPHQQPTAKKTVMAGFTRADGIRDEQGSYTKRMGPSLDADLDEIIVHEKTELACGCYWPDAQVGGVCPECIQDGGSPNVCKAHYLVCQCGTPCCWKHSSPLEDGKTRICSRCHIRAQNKAFKAAVVGALGRLARRVFFGDTSNPPSQE
jgi:hypothetical protein